MEPSMKRPAVLIGVLIAVVAVTAFVLLIRPAEYADTVLPTGVGDLVQGADAIVVGRYVSIEDAGVEILFTPEPTPTDARLGTVYPLDPTAAAPLVGTNIVIDRI